MRSLTAFISSAVFLALARPAVIAGDPVLAWNEAFTRCVRREMPPPCLVARNLAILHLAMHGAVCEAQTAGLALAEIERAADAAGAQVCRSLFPAQSGEFAKAGIEDGAAMQIGERSARAVLAWRENDGASTDAPYIPSAKPGQWRRTEPRLRPPEMPNWGRTKPFVMESGAQFRAAPPPALASAEYAEAVEEVRRIGGAQSESRTAEQTLIARFWSDFSYTSTPPGHWNNIARDLARERELPLAETARLFALLNVAMADAGIAVWEAKYHFNSWRPITAIQRGDEDGNPATRPDPQWKSLLPSPPHPEYVSGHAAFSGAAAQILATFLGGDCASFTATSDELPGEIRRFDSLCACAEEISQSRVYGGIHFSFSGRNGLEIGRKVADFATANFDRVVTAMPATVATVSNLPSQP